MKKNDMFSLQWGDGPTSPVLPSWVLEPPASTELYAIKRNQVAITPYPLLVHDGGHGTEINLEICNVTGLMPFTKNEETSIMFPPVFVLHVTLSFYKWPVLAQIDGEVYRSWDDPPSLLTPTRRRESSSAPLSEGTISCRPRNRLISRDVTCRSCLQRIPPKLAPWSLASTRAVLLTSLVISALSGGQLHQQQRPLRQVPLLQLPFSELRRP